MKKLIKKVGYKTVLAILFSIHLFILNNLRFTAWPEMVAWPYLMLHGWLPYRDIAIAHTPLLLVDLTLFNTFFGVGLIQLKIYTWILILTTDLLIYYVVKKLWDTKTAILTLVFYIPLQIIFEGNGLWFDLALAPLVILIYYNLKKEYFFWTGILLGLAFFTKQTAFWLVFAIGFYLFRNMKSKILVKIINITEGFLSITLSVLVLAAVLRILPDFFEWTFKFGVFYLPGAEGQISFPSLKQFLISIFPFIILTPLVFWKKKEDLDLVVFTIFATLGIFPRFEYFHFQPALPLLSVAIAVVFLSVLKNTKAIYKIAIIGYFTILFIFLGRFLQRNWNNDVRFYGQEETNVASYIKASVSPGGKIYVINYWDSIYAMTYTLPAIKPLVPYLPWYLEYSDLKDSVVDSLIIGMPKLIVRGEYSQSGLGSYTITKIDSLIDRYYTLSYKKGNVEIYQLNK